MFAQPCPYCGVQMRKPTRDHILSLAKIRQLPLPPEAKAKLARMKLVVCKGCNHQKSCRTLLEWHDHLVQKRDRRYRHVLRIIGRIMATMPREIGYLLCTGRLKYQ